MHFSIGYDYKEDSVVVSNAVPGKGTLVTRCAGNLVLVLSLTKRCSRGPGELCADYVSCSVECVIRRHRVSVCVQIGGAALWQGQERRGSRADDVPSWCWLSVAVK